MKNKPYIQNKATRSSRKELEEKVFRFFLDLGADFALIGTNYRFLGPNGQNYYPELVMFHIPSRRLVVFKIHKSTFRPTYLGKLNFYLTAADEDLKKEGENPSVGILLCEITNEDTVRLALKGYERPICVIDIQNLEESKKQISNFIETKLLPGKEVKEI